MRFLGKVKWDKILIWVPSAVLAVTAIIVITGGQSDNSDRLVKLENRIDVIEAREANNNKVLTFVIGDSPNRFRIVCKEDNSTSIFTCATIKLAPSPVPSPTR